MKIMVYYCEKCNRIYEHKRKCPICGKKTKLYKRIAEVPARHTCLTCKRWADGECEVIVNIIKAGEAMHDKDWLNYPYMPNNCSRYEPIP